MILEVLCGDAAYGDAAHKSRGYTFKLDQLLLVLAGRQRCLCMPRSKDQQKMQHFSEVKPAVTHSVRPTRFYLSACQLVYIPYATFLLHARRLACMQTEAEHTTHSPCLKTSDQLIMHAILIMHSQRC